MIAGLMFGIALSFTIVIFIFFTIFMLLLTILSGVLSPAMMRFFIPNYLKLTLKGLSEIDKKKLLKKYFLIQNPYMKKRLYISLFSLLLIFLSLVALDNKYNTISWGLFILGSLIIIIYYSKYFSTKQQLERFMKLLIYVHNSFGEKTTKLLINLFYENKIKVELTINVGDVVKKTQKNQYIKDFSHYEDFPHDKEAQIGFTFYKTLNGDYSYIDKLSKILC